MKKILYSFIVLLSGLIFNSCSTDEQQNDSKGLVDLRTIQFTVSEESFGEDKQLTRSVAEPVKKLVDLGNGFTAEVAVERDAKDKEATRATAPLTDGTYCIYAVGSDGKRIKGAGKLGKGVVKDGVLKLDERTDLILPAGQYTFVCYNKYVTDDGDKLTFTDDTRARVGTTTQIITATPSRQKVAFIMKRQVARVRFKITAYTQAISNIDAKLVSTADQPTSISYSGLIANPKAVTSTSVDKAVAFPATSNTKNILAFDFFTPYQYYLAGTDGKALKLSFSQGTVYQKSLAGKELTLNNLGILEGNGSYTVRIKLMTTPLYLYQDGTIGIYEERGTRTPIGVMVTEKTKENAQPGEEGAGLAISLKYADLGTYESGVPRLSYLRSGESLIDNNVMYDVEDEGGTPAWAKRLYNDLNGYYNTWNTASNGPNAKAKYANTAKADISIIGIDNVNQPYYLAGHYNPGVAVTGSNVSKWFLPTVGQFILALRTLKIVDVPLNAFITNPGEYYGLDTILLPYDEETGEYDSKDIVFTKAGGHALLDDRFQNKSASAVYVWTSTFASNFSTNAFVGFAGEIAIWTKYGGVGAAVRPFVHF
ncbi:hypothetical protein KZO60_00405 [Prevotella nanceiensis]|uniref:hypothetical protein n=1 Tax=Hoylesella nanceiensis TaxID=425941 RepID=UPI001C5F113E|nr:hypothetical protein [Hoylesella nanceiensis]MBW4766189.1 hypothetical protein [Hoylesella nanceiensis]